MAARFPGARPVDLPLDTDSSPLFTREAADVHAGLCREQRGLRARRRAKIELCLQVTDREADAAGRARALLREQWLELVEDSTCRDPDAALVAPPCASAEDDASGAAG